MFKKITLANGLRIIVAPQKKAQTATVLALVGTGSKYETKDISGISHFLEHMYFKGTEKRPSVLSVSETMDKLGGTFNAFTGEEFTGYFAKVAAPHLERALEWVSDIYLNSLLPEKEIEKERQVIMEEINMYADMPMMYVRELWKSLLYGDQPAGWDIAGSRESLANIYRPQLVDYMQSQYVAKNTIVCVAGKVEVAVVVDQVSKYFRKIRVADFKAKPLVVEKQDKPAVLLHYKETDQTHLALGVRTFYNVLNSKKQAASVIGTILGGMMSSRLFYEVRDRLGLAYYVRTGVEADTDTGYLVTLAGVDNLRVEKAITAILKEYKRIMQEKVGVSELTKAKENLKGRLSLSLETSDAQALFYAGQELLERRINKVEDIFKEVDAITPAEVLAVAQDIFKPANLNLALVGPFKDKAKFQRLLKL